MREGLKWSHKMTQTEAFKKNKISPIVDKFSCGDHVAFSDSYFECFLRHWSHTIYHSVGTCKMGPRSDPLSVVDAQLRVHRVENLRVADASIMPVIVGANTNAPIIMIGEKAADMIIKNWAAKTSKGSTKKDSKGSAKKDSKSKTEL
jgi:choline dehydrogenase-like flavoprotein